MAEVNRPNIQIQVTDGVLIPSKSEKTLFSSWRISFFGALVLLAILPILGTPQVQEFLIKLSLTPPTSESTQAQKAQYQAKIETLTSISKGTYTNNWWNFISQLPQGILVTFSVTAVSILLAMVMGLLVAFGQLARNPILNRIATVYVEVIRGIPLMVQIFYIYFALGKVVKLDDFTAAVISLAICYGAYIGEIFRAGIQAIPKGQVEAALALGMRRSQAIRYIVLPQTLRIVIPAIGNEFIAMLKDTSMVSIMALTDIMRQARDFGSSTLDYFPPLTIVALVYLIMTLFLSRGVAFIEERMNQGHGR